jgi:hypothetical protein
VEINRSGPEEVIPWVDVALVMKRGGQCSSSSVVPETNLPGRSVDPGPGQGRGLSMHDQNNDIAAALDRLHAGGWSIGDTAFHDIEHGRVVWVISGTNGENQIRAEGATRPKAWRRALDQAAAVSMLPGRPRPARE